MFDETSLNKGSNVTLNVLGRDACRSGYLRDIVAGVGHKASQHHTLWCIYSLNGADYSLIKTNNQMVSEVFI